MTDTVKGEIQNLSIQDRGTDKERHGVKVQGEWHNRFGLPDGYSEGDHVKIKYETNDYGRQIQEINILEDGNQTSGGEESGSSANAQNKRSDGGRPSSNTFTSKDERINKKVAFKEACETARQEDLKVQAPEEGGEHIQLVSKLANGYFQLLQELGEEQ